MFKGSIPALITPCVRTVPSTWRHRTGCWIFILTKAATPSSSEAPPANHRPSPRTSSRRRSMRLGAASRPHASDRGQRRNSTSRSVALSRAAVEAGADALLVVTPLQPADAGGPLPAFHSHRGRGGRACVPL